MPPRFESDKQLDRFRIYGHSKVLSDSVHGTLLDHGFGELHWYYRKPHPSLPYAVATITALGCSYCSRTSPVKLAKDNGNGTFDIVCSLCDSHQGRLVRAVDEANLDEVTKLLKESLEESSRRREDLPKESSQRIISLFKPDDTGSNVVEFAWKVWKAQRTVASSEVYDLLERTQPSLGVEAADGVCRPVRGERASKWISEKC